MYIGHKDEPGSGEFAQVPAVDVVEVGSDDVGGIEVVIVAESCVVGRLAAIVV